MDVWVIRAGKVGEREEWCFANGYAGGGFNNIDDLSSCVSRDDIKSVSKHKPKVLPRVLKFNLALELLTVYWSYSF